MNIVLEDLRWSEKNNQKWKKKSTVWADLRTALDSEKSFRQLRPGSIDWWCQVVPGMILGSVYVCPAFRLLESSEQRGARDTLIFFMIFMLQWARKWKIGLPKNVFTKILIKFEILLFQRYKIFWNCIFEQIVALFFFPSNSHFLNFSIVFKCVFCNI